MNNGSAQLSAGVASVYEFVIASADKHGRRRASPMLVYADMFKAGIIDSYEQRGWVSIGGAVAVLAAHGLLRIEHGPEKQMYSTDTQSMIQVCNWERVRRKRAAIAKSTRTRVYERDGHACVACGSTEALSLDHIVPWSLGGSDDVDNLQTMCRPCNSSKGARADV